VLLRAIDLVYEGAKDRVLTGTWWLCMAYLASLAASMLVAMRHGVPGVQTGNVVLSTLLFLAPFTAALVVIHCNRNDPAFRFGELLFMGLGLLLAINVLGYAAGIRSVGHSFEGRANFPFIRGIYTGAHVLAIWALMLLFKLRAPGQRPVAYALAGAALLLCMYFMVKINSRLSFLIFLILGILFVTRAMKAARGLYITSLFTMPLLLSSSLLLYQVLSQPFFTALVQRVSKEDVTTFNGRSYIWVAVGDWLMNDRTGILVGNGYKGHYTLGLLDFVAVLWDEPRPYNLHTHATVTEVLVAQGIFGVLLLYMLFWRAFRFYRERYVEGHHLAPVFAGFAYLLFIWQLDIFCYGVEIGHAILFCILAPLCYRPPVTSAALLE